MSDDLLKEFAHTESEPWVQRLHDTQSSAEDDFGDFEDAELDSLAPVRDNAPIFIAGLLVVPEQATLEQFRGAETHEAPTPAPTKPPHLSQSGTSNTNGEQQSDAWGELHGGTVLFDSEQEIPEIAPQSRPGHATSALEVGLDDEAFDAWEPAESAEDHISMNTLQPQASGTKSVTIRQHSKSTTRDNGPPPANVPPPSLLLSLGAALIRAEGIKFKRKRAPTHDRQAHSEHVSQLLADFQALARILAGRRARWKRDNILSQSMNIGMAGKQGGMKLTKVDKTENRREDQEAAELLRIWRTHVGAFKTTFASLGRSPPPEMDENMPIRVESPAKGAITAQKPCFLCGIRREERVLRLDSKVEDSFGEWWQEYWGHVTCVEFWHRYEDSLPHR